MTYHAIADLLLSRPLIIFCLSSFYSADRLQSVFVIGRVCFRTSYPRNDGGAICLRNIHCNDLLYRSLQQNMFHQITSLMCPYIQYTYTLQYGICRWFMFFTKVFRKLFSLANYTVSFIFFLSGLFMADFTVWFFFIFKGRMVACNG